MRRTLPNGWLAALPFVVAPALGACTALGLLDGYSDGEPDASVSVEQDAGTDALSNDARDGSDATLSDQLVDQTVDAADASDEADGGGCVSGTKQPCYTGPPGTLNEGICRAGSQTCTQGVWGACEGQVQPAAEQCNGGVDDDCNGQKDEGCTCTEGTIQSCGSDEGECRAGTMVCAASGTWGACTDEVTAVAEECDGLDNDCDGEADENLTRSCYSGPAGTEGQGECRAGTQVCSNGAWGMCDGEVLPVAEECDGLDNNCNGKIDDGIARECYTGPAGTAGVGECHGGTQACVSGNWGTCVGEVKPVAELCNGKDDNCDGSGDETQDVNTGVPCGQQCVSSADDGDCDGLKDPSDPWGAVCNTLLFSDGFLTKPGTPVWQFGAGTDSWTCGVETLNAGTTLFLGNPGYLSTPTYFAETRVALGPATASANWRVGLATAYSTASITQWRTCEIWYNQTVLTTDAGPPSGPVVYSSVVRGATNKTDWVKGLSLDGSEGAEYRLQSWGTSTEHHCRAVSADGLTVLGEVVHSTATTPFTVGGTVQLMTTGRQGQYDYLRVFSMP